MSEKLTAAQEAYLKEVWSEANKVSWEVYTYVLIYGHAVVQMDSSGKCRVVSIEELDNYTPPPGLYTVEFLK